jgi:hypothetical protein
MMKIDMNVLLIIDMQNAWLNNSASPCFDVEGVVKRINHAARSVRPGWQGYVHLLPVHESFPLTSSP